MHHCSSSQLTGYDRPRLSKDGIVWSTEFISKTTHDSATPPDRQVEWRELISIYTLDTSRRGYEVRKKSSGLFAIQRTKKETVKYVEHRAFARLIVAHKVVLKIDTDNTPM